MDWQRPNTQTLTTWIQAAFLAFFVILIIAYGVAGLFSRYYSDDFYFVSLVHQHGFFGAQAVVYQDLFGRFTTTALIMGVAMLGQYVLPYFFFAVLVLWLVVTHGCTNALTKLAGVHLGRLGRLTLTSGIVGTALISMRGVFVHNIYWLSALSYPLSIVGLTGLIWLIADRSNTSSSRPSWLSLVGVFFLGLVVGGFLEAFTVVQMTLLAVMSIIATIELRGPRRTTILRLLAVAFVGTFVGLLIMAVAPGNIVRFSTYSTSLGIGEALAAALSHTWYLIVLMTGSAGIAPFFFYGFFAAVIGFGSAKPFTVPQSSTPPKRWSAFIRPMIFGGLGVLLATTVNMAVVMYSIGAPYYTHRMLDAPYFLWSVFVIIGGFIFGQTTRRILPIPGVPTLRLTLYVIICTNLMLLISDFGSQSYLPFLTNLLSRSSTQLVYYFTVVSLGIFALILYRRKYGRLIATMLFVVCLLGIVLRLGTSYAQPLTEVWGAIESRRQNARLWDLRDQQIKNLRQQGFHSLKIRALDFDVLTDKPLTAHNEEIADYYRLDLIKPMPPPSTDDSNPTLAQPLP